MNKGSIVERLCSDLIAKNRNINGLRYFTLLYFTIEIQHCVFEQTSTSCLGWDISETVRDRDLGPKDHQYEMANGESNGQWSCDT